jgi:hypothetical protein
MNFPDLLRDHAFELIRDRMFLSRANLKGTSFARAIFAALSKMDEPFESVVDTCTFQP